MRKHTLHLESGDIQSYTPYNFWESEEEIKKITDFARRIRKDFNSRQLNSHRLLLFSETDRYPTEGELSRVYMGSCSKNTHIRIFEKDGVPVAICIARIDGEKNAAWTPDGRPSATFELAVNRDIITDNIEHSIATYCTVNLKSWAQSSGIGCLRTYQDSSDCCTGRMFHAFLEQGYRAASTRLGPEEIIEARRYLPAAK